jgi:hypothetical protein
MGQEGPILPQDFAVVDDKATFQLDADSGFEQCRHRHRQVEEPLHRHPALLFGLLDVRQGVADLCKLLVSLLPPPAFLL